MPLPLVAHVVRVPSTARSLYTLDEHETLPSKRQQTVGEYTLVEHLGAGASGSNVYAATHAGCSEVFAVKVLRAVDCANPAVSSCASARFAREAELTCALSAPVGGLRPHRLADRAADRAAGGAGARANE